VLGHELRPEDISLSGQLVGQPLQQTRCPSETPP
jgi:hypothetical protein